MRQKTLDYWRRYHTDAIATCEISGLGNTQAEIALRLLNERNALLDACRNLIKDAETGTKWGPDVTALLPLVDAVEFADEDVDL